MKTQVCGNCKHWELSMESIVYRRWEPVHHVYVGHCMNLDCDKKYEKRMYLDACTEWVEEADRDKWVVFENRNQRFNSAKESENG